MGKIPQIKHCTEKETWAVKIMLKEAQPHY